MSNRILVIGPAYLDRVLRVDRPLIDPALGGPLDLSVEGEWAGPGSASTLTLRDPAGSSIRIQVPPGWPEGPGEILLSRPFLPGAGALDRAVVAGSWQDDLGGMGAGFASALGGTLFSAIGSESDPISQQVAALLDAERIDHRPLRVPDRVADWTLLVSSGPFGDKLPIGFRGCHAALDAFDESTRAPADLLIVASLTNRLAALALNDSKATIRVFAPTLRNLLDRSPPLSSFAGSIDILVCNRREWEALNDREIVARHLSLLSVTDGPAGSRLWFRNVKGDFEELRLPAFPRSSPPKDTNRAGEAYASTLLATLLEAGWTPGPTAPELAGIAALRASTAAALVLDRPDFGFPDAEAIEAARRAGIVGS